METNQYMDLFLEESREHLQSLNDGLLSLEDNADDMDVVNEIFRNAHTLKGMSATMGFNVIAELTHEMEDVLDLIRKGKLKINGDITDTLFKCIDSLEQMVDSVSSGELENTVDTSNLVKALALISKGTPLVSDSKNSNKKIKQRKQNTPTSLKIFELEDADYDVMRQAKDSGNKILCVQITLAVACVLKYVRAFMVIRAVDSLGCMMKISPSTELLEQEKFDRTFSFIMITEEQVEKVEKVLGGISEIDEIKVTEVDPNKKEGISEIQKPIVEEKKIIKPETRMGDVPKAVSSLVSKLVSNKKKTHQAQFLRVEIGKLDTLMNLMGELVINKGHLEQIGQTRRIAELSESLEYLERITTDLQNIVMKVRMVPVGDVFKRFPRMVRDLAKELGKEVNLVIEGEDTELDRTVIDEIGDPIMHLLRNALDHGLEHPEERIAKGKSQIGTVNLLARHEGNSVVILVKDDGAGIDASKLRAKAVEKGLLTQEAADRMDDNEAVRIVFMPGFSTAEKITDVSGRGVGMDVVCSKITALSGSVDVETKKNEGSVFKIKLPLTLAIIQAMMVVTQDEMYAVPLGNIDRTVRIKPSDIQTIKDKEIIVLRGEVIPIIHLDKVLGVSHKRESENIFVIVVQVGNTKAGIIVDDLLGQQEIVIKSLGTFFEGIKLFSGATVLGDGRVSLILDIPSVLEM